MLATLGTLADLAMSDDDWAIEMKWDGIRAIAIVTDGRVELRTRNGIDVTAAYPELAQLVDRVAQNVVLDGEIVALNRRGRPDFGLLQQRMKLTRKPEVDAAVATIPVNYMVFDLLRLGGSSLERETYDKRRAALVTAVRSGGAIHVPDAFDGDAAAAMAASGRLGLEGVVAKKRDGTYSAGRRSRAWIKVKHHLTQEVVIGGWRPGTGRRAHGVGSLLMGIPSDSGLQYVGRVGTGFGEKELAELADAVQRLPRKTSPFYEIPRQIARDAHWVSPTLVGEVEFAEWTNAGILRQPSWRGWRPDKTAADVVREVPVIGGAQAPAWIDPRAVNGIG
jgi:bifunctional non-homologous end joining protein LigD